MTFIHMRVLEGGWNSSNHSLPPLLPWRCNSIPSEKTHKAQWGYQMAHSAYPQWKHKPRRHQPNRSTSGGHTHPHIHANRNHISFSLKSINGTFALLLMFLRPPEEVDFWQESHQSGRWKYNKGQRILLRKVLISVLKTYIYSLLYIYIHIINTNTITLGTLNCSVGGNLQDNVINLHFNAWWVHKTTSAGLLKRPQERVLDCALVQNEESNVKGLINRMRGFSIEGHRGQPWSQAQCWVARLSVVQLKVAVCNFLLYQVLINQWEYFYRQIIRQAILVKVKSLFCSSNEKQKICFSFSVDPDKKGTPLPSYSHETVWNIATMQHLFENWLRYE